MEGNDKRKRNRRQVVSLCDLNYGRVPPQAREIEEVVLGAILLEPKCLPEVVNYLCGPEVFYVDAHQRIYKSILSLYDKSNRVDMLTVVEQLKKEENLDIVGGIYAITKLTNSVVSSVHIDDHCRLLLEMYLKREAIRIGGELVNEAYSSDSDAFDIYDNADGELLKTQERVLSGSVKDMAFFSKSVYESYETVKTTGVLGIHTGIIPCDRIFCGLVAPDLLIIAARPGAGKTSLALSWTYNVSVLREIAGAWFSLEMDGTQLTRRLVSIDAKIPHEVIRNGLCSGDDEIRLYISMDKIASAPIFIEDKTSVNVRSIRTRANILKRKNNIQYIIVDYLQLMSGSGKSGQNREGEISEISRGLKTLAKELGIPVIALSQLSRKVEERADKMPQLSDLRESGAIEQDADEVLFLMRPKYYEFTEPVMIRGKEYPVQGLCIGKVAKNRHGQTENFAMSFHGPTMHFSTHELDYNGNIPYENKRQPDPSEPCCDFEPF